MGFIKAFSGALSGSFADQWKDYLTVPNGLPDTVGLCRATSSSNDSNRTSNDNSSDCIITNGSLVVVPEGYSLITLENGAITGYVDEPGGYQWQSDNVNSRSFLSGSSVPPALIKQSWERFKFGGTPGASQIAVYINLKEIPNNKFGTQSPIYWDDAYLNTQVGATARGTYTLRIEDPLLFVKEFVPARYYSFNSSAYVFDFADFNNDAANQLFTEVVASLAAAFSSYANAAGGFARIAGLQCDTVGFTNSLVRAVDANYAWSAKRGLAIVQAALIAVEYDPQTKDLIANVQRADAMMGARGNSNLQASLAQGFQSAGENPEGGALGMGFMGMAFNGVGGTAGTIQQPVQVSPNGAASYSATAQAEDPYEKLEKTKGLLDKGIITQKEFDAIKAKTLGL